MTFVRVVQWKLIRISLRVKTASDLTTLLVLIYVYLEIIHVWAFAIENMTKI